MQPWSLVEAEERQSMSGTVVSTVTKRQSFVFRRAEMARYRPIKQQNADPALGTWVHGVTKRRKRSKVVSRCDTRHEMNSLFKRI